jgi:hypothetical protein
MGHIDGKCPQNTKKDKNKQYQSAKCNIMKFENLRKIERVFRKSL